MNLHTLTRIPVDDDYVALIGKAVYMFAYYEWTIIWIIQYLGCEFVHEYSRVKTITSGAVGRRFNGVIEKNSVFVSVDIDKLKICSSQFSKLISRRNALIHAHPCTDKDGSQILNYQGPLKNDLPDIKWSISEVKKVIEEIDDAACAAGKILDQLRSSPLD